MTSAMVASPPKSPKAAAYPQAQPGAFHGTTMDEMRNPADLGFPPMLPMELALRIDTPAKVCEAYGITKEQFTTIIAHPVFVKQYQEAVEALKVDGMSFKVKAKMLAEDYLTTAFGMVKNPNTSDAVRADLIKQTVRWAGYDTKATDGAASPNFSIQINLV